MAELIEGHGGELALAALRVRRTASAPVAVAG